MIRTMYRLEIDTGHGGYGFDCEYDELIRNVLMEYGKREAARVKTWLRLAKENDQYESPDGRMIITNIGEF